ncbi:MAG TPA: signal peptide peptidase SppA [Candidatus Nanoarchaeia archaeon]|nr:signal peptide peptidase SppA [Candidatus Nanoarchaeia archaeon]
MEKKRQDEYPKTRWGILLAIVAVVIIIGAAFIGMLVSLFDSPNPGLLGKSNVALIKIEGPILTGKESFFEPVASSSEIMGFIEEASEDSGIDAIILEINSPGGSAVASDEIVSSISKVKKPKISFIREVGASGAYWVAASTDYIIANRLSITGSVGVISSYLEFAGLLRDYNVTYRRLVAGKYKDIGDPFRELTNPEEAILQQQLDEVHSIFLSDVAEKRRLTQAQTAEISTGLFFIGAKAKELGLVDELGGKEEAVAYLENKFNASVNIIEYKKEPSFAELFTGLLGKNSFLIGKGIGSSMVQDRVGLYI